MLMLHNEWSGFVPIRLWNEYIPKRSQTTKVHGSFFREADTVKTDLKGTVTCLGTTHRCHRRSPPVRCKRRTWRCIPHWKRTVNRLWLEISGGWTCFPLLTWNACGGHSRGLSGLQNHAGLRFCSLLLVGSEAAAAHLHFPCRHLDAGSEAIHSPSCKHG